MLARRVQRAAAPLAAVAALTLCLLTGSGVRADHLDGDFHGEHERVGVARKVADLAISNLNAVEQPTDELYTLGRVLSVDNAVNHAYKSVVPRGERAGAKGGQIEKNFIFGNFPPFLFCFCLQRIFFLGSFIRARGGELRHRPPYQTRCTAPFNTLRPLIFLSPQPFGRLYRRCVATLSIIFFCFFWIFAPRTSTSPPLFSFPFPQTHTLARTRSCPHHHPPGLFLSLAYEAIKNSTKQTAYCNVEVGFGIPGLHGPYWLSLINWCFDCKITS
jgi:hypothetical protein